MYLLKCIHILSTDFGFVATPPPPKKTTLQGCEELVLWAVSVHGGGGGLVTQSSDSLRPTDCSPQASPSMGFSRQRCWRGLPFPSPGSVREVCL